MNEFDVLRTRVEETAEMLAAAEANRHRQHGSLAEILVRLEHKFNAQREELDFYKARVAPLEEINHQLADLMERLLAMIDQGFGEASIVPLRAATEAASRILGEEMPAVTAGEAPAETGEMSVEADEGGQEAVAEAAAPAGEADDAVTAVAEDEGVFDDVGEDALSAEAEAELDTDTKLPETVMDAHLAAVASTDDDPLAEIIGELDEDVGADLDIPEDGQDEALESMEELAAQLAAETAGYEQDDGNDRVDIRSLLARVEAAVEEVRSKVEPAPAAETDERTPSAAVA